MTAALSQGYANANMLGSLRNTRHLMLPPKQYSRSGAHPQNLGTHHWLHPVLGNVFSTRNIHVKWFVAYQPTRECHFESIFSLPILSLQIDSGQLSSVTSSLPA